MYNQKPLSGDLIDYGDPLSQGLVSFWPMQEGSGSQVFDLSGNDRIGTLTNAAWIGGKFGSALKLTDGYITIAPSLSMTNRNLSFVCWVKDPTNIKSGVFGSNHATTPYKYITCHINENGNIRCYIGNGASYDTISAANPDSSDWHQYGWTVGPAANGPLKTYYDGRQIDLQALTYVPTVFTVEIGSHGYRPLDGSQDIPILWNRVLTDSEIALLYREPFCMVRTRKRRIIYDEIAAAPGLSIPIAMHHYKMLKAS